MGSYFLWIFALAALPSLMAIHCYKCMYKPPNNMCLSPTNVTDCDEPLKGVYDACGKASFEIELAGNKQFVNFMICTKKSWCDILKKKFCNATSLQSLGIVKKCDYSCCSEDKCNGTSGIGSIKAIPFIAVFLNVLSIFIH